MQGHSTTGLGAGKGYRVIQQDWGVVAKGLGAGKGYRVIQQDWGLVKGTGSHNRTGGW